MVYTMPVAVLQGDFWQGSISDVKFLRVGPFIAVNTNGSAGPTHVRRVGQTKNSRIGDVKFWKVAPFFPYGRRPQTIYPPPTSAIGS